MRSKRRNLAISQAEEHGTLDRVESAFELRAEAREKLGRSGEALTDVQGGDRKPYAAALLHGPAPFPEAGELTKPWSFMGKTYPP